MRAYEGRLDLMRCVIFGPEGTPYEHGAFAFDLALPGEYPSEPPLVKYLSVVSQRLNPNLYEDGKVCLSLLGTWSGPGWTPESTILQVLTSIQGLVLVPQPFFNEPGYEQSQHTPQGQQNARRYNENARLLTLRAMLATAAGPPRHLRGVIRDHFARNGASVVEKCEALVGTAGAAPPGEGAPSAGFLRMLQRLLPALRERIGDPPAAQRSRAPRHAVE